MSEQAVPASGGCREASGRCLRAGVLLNARLEGLVASTRAALERRRAAVPLSELEEAAAAREDEQRPFAEALARPGTSLIAEHKRRSPSAGMIGNGRSCGEVVAAYERGGAAALSVLTEEEHFGGSLEDLREARGASALPILRKDFTIDRYMLHEARAAGADAVLLVVGSLGQGELIELHTEAHALDLDAVVEISRPEELELALRIDADVIGINNRDLEDFTVDITRTFDLLADVPAGKTVVSESGIVYREQVEELERVGVDAVLVGETLMRAPDQEEAVRALVGEVEPGAK